MILRKHLSLQLAAISFLYLMSIPALAAEKLEFTASNYQLYIGEDLQTAELVFQTDSPGHFFSEYAKYEFNSIHWVGWDLEVINTYPDNTNFEYFISMLGSFELYLDEQLLGINGVVSDTKSNEEPGQIETSFLISGTLLKSGKHRQFFKISNHYRPKDTPLFRHAFMEPYNVKDKYISLGSLIPTLLVSVSFFFGLYILALFFIDKLNFAYIYLSISCIALFIFGYSIQWPHLIGYTYDWALINQRISLLSGSSFPLLLLLFYMLKHDYHKQWYVILILPIMAWLFSLLTDSISYFQLYWISGFILCATLLIAKYYQSKQNYWWEIVGLITVIIPLLQDHGSLEDSVTFIPLLLLLILMTNLFEIRQRIMSGYHYKLRSARLESQLLRKNIQPHFVLNSLTSLTEWVDTEPQKSIEFISAMAEEFRIFSDIADKKFIKVDIEIELCRNHLMIMHFRMQQDYELIIKGETDGLLIPPGILITLIEGAFSHNNYSENNASISLAIEKNLDRFKLTLSAPRYPHEESAYKSLGTGMGEDYIKSQLTRAYADEWQFSSQAEGNLWVTRYSIPKTPGRSE